MLNIFGLYRALNLDNIVELVKYGCGHEIRTEMMNMDIGKRKEFAEITKNHNVSYFDEFYIEETMFGMNRELVLVKIDKCGCPRCHKPEHIKCADMPRPTGFDNVELYHGVDAYNWSDPMENLSNLLNNTSWEICTSSRMIGNFGVKCTGDVEVASSIDLCSFLFDGARYFMVSERAVGIVSDINQLDKSMWHHNEIIMKDFTVTGLWVRETYDKEIISKLKDKAKELNINLEIVK